MPNYESWPYLETEGDFEDKGDYIVVTVKATGKPANLAKSEIQKWGNKIFVKQWLHDRICPNSAAA